MFSQIRNISIACIILITLGGFFQTATADIEANKAIAIRVADLWSTGDLSIADEIFAADVVPHVPHYPHVTDLDSYKEQVTNSRTEVQDVHIEVHDMVAEGDKVAYRFTVTGT
jgi:predicted ester cyclase